MAEQESHHTRSAHLRTDPKTGEKTIPVAETQVKNRGRMELTEEQKAARERLAGALTNLTKAETMSDFFEPVDDFKELPTPFQIATIATIADVPWAAAGPPGTGKTVSGKEIGRGLGLQTEVVRAGASTQSDFEGIPAVVGEAGQEVMKRLPPEWALRVQDQNALVFLDEINRASVDVQNALLKLTGDDRDIEGMELGPNVRIAAPPVHFRGLAA
jgi:DNA polymerase III delta prime subunit